MILAKCWNKCLICNHHLIIKSWQRFSFCRAEASITENTSHQFFLTLGFQYYCHYHWINVKNLTSNTLWHGMISTHFEFSMYGLGAAFCQQIQIHWIWHLVLSVIEFYDKADSGKSTEDGKFLEQSFGCSKIGLSLVLRPPLSKSNVYSIKFSYSKGFEENLFIYCTIIRE